MCEELCGSLSVIIDMAVLLGVTGEDADNVGREWSDYKFGYGSQACSVSPLLELKFITALDHSSISLKLIVVSFGGL